MIINKISPAEITQDVKKLLLLADPDLNMVEKYLYSSEIYTILDDDQLLGVLVIKHYQDPVISEIMNIAVKDEHQNKGYGKMLLEYSEKVARMAGSKCLEIGTADSSIKQMYIYQKFGFRFHGIIKDFFLKYGNEMYENGIKCVDLVKFRKIL